MKVARQQNWNLSVAEAIACQKQMVSKLVLKDGPRSVRIVAGADVAYEPSIRRCFASVVVLELPGFKLLEESLVHQEVSFPYVPGLLSFREGPVILEAFAKLRSEPQVVFFDGHGYAHPRRFGLACHIGYLLDVPSIGCAKSLLVGEPEEPLPLRAGAWVWLRDNGKRIGAVLRTRTGKRPIYVSPGYKVGFAAAVRLTQSVVRNFRVPEPTRLADIVVKKFKRDYLRFASDKR